MFVRQGNKKNGLNSYIVGKHTNKTVITLDKKNRKICINFALDYTVGVTNINNVHYSLLKVYTEGFRVLLLNRRVIGCKSINLYPIV